LRCGSSSAGSSSTRRWGKLTNPAWVDGSGEAILRYWTNALAVNNGRPVITYDWYRAFIQLLVDSGAAGGSAM
jgi:hypothetical protein